MPPHNGMSASPRPVRLSDHAKRRHIHAWQSVGAQDYREKRLFIPILVSHPLRFDFSHLFRQLQRLGILKTQLDINHVPVEITPVV